MTKSALVVFVCCLQLATPQATRTTDGVGINAELERLCMEAVVACFKKLSRHLLGWTEETHGNSARTSSVPAETRTDHLRNTARAVRDETPQGRAGSRGGGALTCRPEQVGSEL